MMLIPWCSCSSTQFMPLLVAELMVRRGKWAGSSINFLHKFILWVDGFAMDVIPFIIPFRMWAVGSDKRRFRLSSAASFMR